MYVLIFCLLTLRMFKCDLGRTNGRSIYTSSKEKENDELYTVRSLVMVRNPVASAKG